MNWQSLVGIAFGLAMDAFAVSLAAGVTLGKVTPRQTFRLAFHFGLFQFLMPIFGWLAGKEIATSIRHFDHWIAFALLAFIGVKMLRDSWRGELSETRTDPTRGRTLVTLSLATSIDALAVGLSMAILDVSVWIPAVVIGVIAAILTGCGIVFGQRVGTRFGHWSEAVGGCVLILIGVQIVYTHLTG